jgi:hypothetical protein
MTQATRTRRPIPVLHNPVKFGVEKASTTAPVIDRGGSISLDAYMRLPVAQYSELDPALISSLGGNRFGLTVPRMSVFNVWVQPSVEITVAFVEAGESSRVLLTAEHCRLEGSNWLRQLHLDQRFRLHWVTELTWKTARFVDNDVRDRGSKREQQSDEVLALQGGDTNASVTATLDLEVWTEVLPPFNVLPRQILLKAAEAALGACTRSLLPMFVNRLAEDYRRWADDAEYRRRRASVETSMR